MCNIFLCLGWECISQEIQTEGFKNGLFCGNWKYIKQCHKTDTVCWWCFKAGPSKTDGIGFQTPLSTQFTNELNTDFSIVFDYLREAPKNSNLNSTLKDIIVLLVLLKVWMRTSASWLTVTVTAFEVGMFFLRKTFLCCNLKFKTRTGLFFYMVIYTSLKQVFWYYVSAIYSLQNGISSRNMETL